MAYGQNTALYVENGPFELVARAKALRSTARSWRVLTEACRLAAVERALTPANDRIDDYPPAL